MKRTLGMMAVLCTAVLLAGICLSVFAESTPTPLQKAADITIGIALPAGYSTDFDISVPEGASSTNKSIQSEVQLDEKGTAALVEVEVLFVDKTVKDADWTVAEEWFRKTVSEAAAGMEADPEKIGKKVLAKIDDDRTHVLPEEDGSLPLWADESLHIASLSVVTPYYPELANGSKGDAVTRLQTRLTELGYFTGVCDGYYGPITAAAVEEVQSMMHSTEQAQIDALATPEPTLAPSPTPDPSATASATPTPDPEAIATPDDAVSLEVTAEPTTEPTTEPTPEPTPAATPATEVNGNADAIFQAFLYSDVFPASSRELQTNDRGDDVTRLQRRLLALGYMTGSADGIYGTGTQRAVRLYQYYNNLDQNGVADMPLQTAVFSADAKGPANPILAQGASGEEVKTLQRRLKYLGFMQGGVDGDYGATTTQGVKNLQKYMRQKEMDALLAASSASAVRQTSAGIAPAPSDENDIAASALATPAPATEADVDMSKVTIEVNGVADPLLLDAFYSDSFPAIPSLLKQGDGSVDVERVQRRLADLEYLYTSPDGQYGAGTTSAISDFQGRNGLSKDGVAGTQTLTVLFSSDAVKALKPYLLKVSTSKQRVYAYAPDSNGDYTVLVRTMKCSTGLPATPTPKGTYQASTGAGARWHYFTKFYCWAQYAYYIQGDIMFHSVLYGSKNGAVTQSSVNHLGSKASHGCVRLSVEDAKWIWNNCPRNTKVIIY